MWSRDWPSSRSSLGWYDDPLDFQRWRYWNGWEWTTRTAPKVVVKTSKWKRRHELRRDLALFVGFTFFLAVVPIAKHGLDLLDKGGVDSGWQLFSTGELNFIAAALVWCSVGDFLLKRQLGLTAKQLLIVGLAGTLLFLEGLLWLYVAYGHGSGEPAVFGWLCLGPFLVSLAIVASIFLVEPEERLG